MENNQVFEGWAVVELFGHVRELGFVTTLYFGNQAMFQIESPSIPEREVILLDSAVFGNEWLPAKSVVVKSEIAAKSRIVGSGSVYAINPSTEAKVVAEIGGNGEISKLITKAEYAEELPF